MAVGSCRIEAVRQVGPRNEPHRTPLKFVPLTRNRKKKQRLFKGKDI